MKIEDALKGVTAVRSREVRKGRTATAQAQPAVPGDSVEITSTSARLNRLEEELAKVESDATDKVEAVRQAIAEGRFEIDEEVVADALVENTMEQLRRQGGR